MLALTLWQPWAYAIASLGKRVENRTWAPPSRILGETIAIHAGQKLDPLAAAKLRMVGHYVPLDLPTGAIVCVARVIGVVSDNPDATLDQPRVHKVASTGDDSDTILALALAADGLWYSGPIGWVLDDVRPLKAPVPCKGMQGLWRLPDDVERQVREQIGGAT